MASKEWNTIDNYELENSEYYCTFLDILGYKNKLDEYFEGSYNLKDRFHRATSSAFDAMKIVSDNNFVDTSKLKVEFFSDSIVLSHPVDENEKDALHNILHFSRVFVGHLSMEGLFVRGGIAKGQHISEKFDEQVSFLSSKALERAYELESKIATYPRVVIDEVVLKNIDKYNQNEFVVKNGNHFMLHYAPQLINMQGNNTDAVFAEMEDIYEIYMNITDEKTKKKYEWLIAYYYWTVANISDIDLAMFEKFKDIKLDCLSVFKREKK